MKFAFEVGDVEKHKIEFRFNQLWGNLSISVDGRQIIRDFRLASLSLTKSYEFKVGIEEIHHVRIDKIRKLLFAGFRKSKYEIYIDGRLAHEYEGW